MKVLIYPYLPPLKTSSTDSRHSTHLITRIFVVASVNDPVPVSYCRWKESHSITGITVTVAVHMYFILLFIGFCYIPRVRLRR